MNQMDMGLGVALMVLCLSNELESQTEKEKLNMGQTEMVWSLVGLLGLLAGPVLVAVVALMR